MVIENWKVLLESEMGPSKPIEFGGLCMAKAWGIRCARGSSLPGQENEQIPESNCRLKEGIGGNHNMQS